MRKLDLSEAIDTSLCDRCGLNEVRREGEICETCAWYVSPHKRPAGLVAPPAGVPIHEIESPIQLKKYQLDKARAGMFCKWEGCTEHVNTSKGLGSFCVKIQENGKTHRQMYVEGKRSQDPNFGRRIKQKHTVKLPAARSHLEAEASNGNVIESGWLSAVNTRIQAAVARVEDAEGQLENARMELKVILKEALEALS